MITSPLQYTPATLSLRHGDDNDVGGQLESIDSFPKQLKYMLDGKGWTPKYEL